MKLSQKNCFGGGWFKTGKMNNYNCEIHFDSWSEKFHFITRGYNNTFNSIWKNMVFDTEDECRIACEEWITKHVKEA